jgi:hypothetical protein
MKVFQSISFVVLGLALIWLGAVHFRSTAHGIGATELMHAKAALEAPARDANAVTDSLAALQRRLRQADDDTIWFSELAAGLGLLQLCIGVALPATVLLVRLRKKKENA